MKKLLCIAVVAACLPAWCTAEPDVAPGAMKHLRMFGDSFFRHGGDIVRIIPLPDNKTVVTAGRDGTVRVWDLSTGKETRRCHHPRCSGIWGAELIPGRSEVLAACDDGRITRWDLKTGEELGKYEQKGTVFRIAVTRKGTRFAAVGADGLCILWDLAKKKEIRRFKGHKGAIYDAAFSSDEARLVTGGGDSTYRTWDIETGQEIVCSDKATGDVYSLTSSPDGSMILVCAAKGVLMLDGKTQEMAWDIKLPESSNCGSWSADGTEVALECDKDGIHILDAKGGHEKSHLPAESGKCWGIAFSADGKELLWADRQLVCRFDRKTGKRLYPRPNAPLQNSPVTHIALTPDGKTLLETSRADGIRTRDANTGELGATWLPDNSVKMVCTPTTGNLVLAISGRDDAWILDAQTGKPAVTMQSQRAVYSDISADGKKALLAYRNMIELHRVSDGTAVRSLNMSGKTLLSAVFNPDATLVAAVADKRASVVIHADTGKLLSEFTFEEDLSHTMFHPGDGRSVLCFGKTNAYCLEAVLPGNGKIQSKKVARLIEDLGHDSFKKRESATLALIAKGDGVMPAILSVKSSDPEVATRVERIRDALLTAGKYKKRSLPELPGINGSRFTFSADGKLWAAIKGTHADTEIQLGTCSGMEFTLVQTLKSRGSARCVRFAGNGRLYTGNANGTVTVYGR